MNTLRTLASVLLLALLSGPASAAVQPCTKIALSPGDLAVGTTGIAYAQSVSATGGSAYTFSITQGVLPAGLAFANATATTIDIAGTASTPGTFVFTLTARNTADGCTGGRTYAFKVNARTVVRQLRERHPSSRTPARWWWTLASRSPTPTTPTWPRRR